jgi:hypothetical protein
MIIFLQAFSIVIPCNCVYPIDYAKTCAFVLLLMPVLAFSQRPGIDSSFISGVGAGLCRKVSWMI